MISTDRELNPGYRFSLFHLHLVSGLLRRRRWSSSRRLLSGSRCGDFHRRRGWFNRSSSRGLHSCCHLKRDISLIKVREITSNYVWRIWNNTCSLDNLDYLLRGSGRFLSGRSSLGRCSSRLSGGRGHLSRRCGGLLSGRFLFILILILLIIFVFFFVLLLQTTPLNYIVKFLMLSRNL